MSQGTIVANPGPRTATGRSSFGYKAPTANAQTRVARALKNPSSATIQRMDVSGIYTTAEEGANRDFYAQAVAIHGAAVAHKSGHAGDNASAKFTNQEATLQETKRDLKAQAEKAAERAAADQRAGEKQEAIAQRREKVLLKKDNEIKQLILFLSDNLPLFPDFAKSQHRTAMLREFPKPKKDKKFTATKELVEDNMERILKMLGTQ